MTEYKKLADASRGNYVEWYSGSHRTGRREGIVVACNETQLTIQSYEIYWIVNRDGFIVDVWLHRPFVSYDEVTYATSE